MVRNEIKLMEAAIALAEELNFSRAAQKTTYNPASSDKTSSRVGGPARIGSLPERSSNSRRQ